LSHPHQNKKKKKETNKQTNTHLNILIKKNRFAIKILPYFFVKENSKSPEFYNREFLPSSKITKGFLIFIF
jgi:hypothetical protein